MPDIKLSAIEELIKYLRKLRDSDYPCTWTQAQSFKSLAPQTLEECYEFMDAIDSNQANNIKDELSDLLYHIIFYAQIAEEKQWFNFDDLARTTLEKHYERLPSDEQRKKLTAEQVNEHWQANKARKLNKPNTLLDQIKNNLPAMTIALKLQHKAAQVGFDWTEIDPIFNKISEELVELKNEINNPDQQQIEAEFGDLLFSCLNLARHLKLDPETALRKTNHKFRQRFAHIERSLKSKNRDIRDASLEEMEQLWNEAK